MAPLLRFLSPEWVGALDDAGRNVSVPPDVRLTVQQVVTLPASRMRSGDRGGGGEGDVRYHLCLADGAIHVRMGTADVADVTLTQPYEVAVALSRAEINGQAALASGLLKLSGALDQVLRHAGALSALDDVFAAVRARTAYE